MNQDDTTFKYSLDVEDGDHSVTFYATDDAGNTGNKSINFSVDTREKKHKSSTGGASNIRYLPEPDEEVQKKKPVVLDEELKKIVKTSEGFNWLWILIILFILAIIITIVLIMRRIN